MVTQVVGGRKSIFVCSVASCRSNALFGVWKPEVHGGATLRPFVRSVHRRGFIYKDPKQVPAKDADRYECENGHVIQYTYTSPPAPIQDESELYEHFALPPQRLTSTGGFFERPFTQAT